jgi:hypothetical protein
MVALYHHFGVVVFTKSSTGTTFTLHLTYPSIFLRASERIIEFIGLTYNNTFGTIGSLFAKFEVSRDCHCFMDGEMRQQLVILHDVTGHHPEVLQIAFLPIYKQSSTEM